MIHTHGWAKSVEDAAVGVPWLAVSSPQGPVSTSRTLRFIEISARGSMLSAHPIAHDSLDGPRGILWYDGAPV